MRRGFTIMELLITIAVIGLLIAILVVGVGGAMRLARRNVDAQTAASLKVAVEQFENELGFLPPLIVDGRPLALDDSNGPFDTNLLGPIVRDEDFLAQRNTDVDAAKRYSKFSLPYYLMGACQVNDTDGDPIDGEPGPSFRTPRRDGLFDPRGRVLDPYFTPRDPSRLVQGYVDPLEYGEHGVSFGGADGTPPASKVALVDRNGRSFRYYRWVNGETSGAVRSRGQVLNIPQIFQDPVTRTDLDASAADTSNELAGAAWAIVGAGNDGYFGTEDLAAFQQKLGSGETNLETAQRRAWRDNIVEVGK
ncbi:MAG: type II secretion system protein [Phycisphaerales bacterium]|nr:type II secretion system protein [Phycisphaerales bacterium]